MIFHAFCLREHSQSNFPLRKSRGIEEKNLSTAGLCKLSRSSITAPFWSLSTVGIFSIKLFLFNTCFYILSSLYTGKASFWCWMWLSGQWTAVIFRKCENGVFFFMSTRIIKKKLLRRKCTESQQKLKCWCIFQSNADKKK